MSGNGNNGELPKQGGTPKGDDKLAKATRGGK